MTLATLKEHLLHSRHDLLGGLSLRPFLFFMAVAVLAAGCIGFAGVFQWEIGEVIDLSSLGLPPYVAYYVFGILGVFFMGLCYVRPEWGLVFYSVLLPFRGEDYVIISAGGADIRAADFFIVPALAAWLLNRMFVNGKGLTPPKLGMELPAIMLLGFCVLSFAWSEAYTSTLSKLIQFVYGLMILLIFVDELKSKKLVYLIFAVWLVGGSLISSSAVLEQMQTGERAVSTQTSALETGEYLNYPILFALSLLLLCKNIWLRAIILGSFLLMVVGTFASGSRGPILGLAAGVIFLAFFSKEYRKMFVWFSAVGGLLGSLVILIMVLLEVNGIGDMLTMPFSRFIELFEHNSVPDVGEMYRIYIWKGIWKLFVENPILGIGVGSLPEVLPDYVPLVFMEPKLAHNLYLEVFIALGPFGFILFTWCFFRVIRICRELISWQDYEYRILSLGIISALVAQAVGGLTFGLFFENRVLWSCLGILFALYLAKNCEATPTEIQGTSS